MPLQPCASTGGLCLPALISTLLREDRNPGDPSDLFCTLQMSGRQCCPQASRLHSRRMAETQGPPPTVRIKAWGERLGRVDMCTHFWRENGWTGCDKMGRGHGLLEEGFSDLLWTGRLLCGPPCSSRTRAQVPQLLGPGRECSAFRHCIATAPRERLMPGTGHVAGPMGGQ